MQHFRLSFLVALVCFTLAFTWGNLNGLVIAIILSIMEVSLSFDNAVVNASVLQQMDEKWQQRFLIWGIMIAVFGMRLLFPIVIVAAIAGIGFLDVTIMAIRQPLEYSRHLHESHIAVSTFGGIFLLLVFLSFILDDEKDRHWLTIEEKLAVLGKLDSIGILISMITLVAVQSFLPAHEKVEMLVAGLSGIILYVLVDSVSGLLDTGEDQELGRHAKRSGVMGFLYLEVLDASFSFDGVIGAFAITKDIIIIMLGLAVGAMFVRSLTVYLVRKGTLQSYVYLEHGAHYAIGALALLMLMSIRLEIAEVLTGLIGVAFIALSLVSSIQYNRLQRLEAE